MNPSQPTQPSSSDRSGEMMAKPQYVPMVDPNDPGKGVIGVHPDDVQRAMSERGLTVETPEEKGIREYQTRNYGSIAEPLKAAGEHALSSATFGLSDALASQIPGYRETRTARDATYHAAAMAGDVAGYLVPGLGEAKMAGTAGKVAKGLAAPVKAVSRVATRAGEATERFVAGQAPGALRGIAAKTVGGAVSGGLEGAAIGVGQAISDASIQDKELTAELLLDHVRNGATIGGAIGGGLSGGVAALSATGKAIGGAGIASKLPMVGNLVSAAQGTRGLEGLAETKFLTSFGFLGSDIKRIIKEGGADAPHRIGRLIADLPEFSGKGAMGRALRHDLDNAAQIATEQVDHYTTKLEGIYKSLDKSGQKVNVADLLERVDQEVLAPLRSSKWGGDAEIVNAIERDLSPLRSAVEHTEGVNAARNLVADFRARVARLDDALRTRSPIADELRQGLRSDAKAIRLHLEEHGMSDAAKALDSALGGIMGGKRSVPRSIVAHLDRMTEGVNSALEHGAPELSYSELWALRKRVDKDITNWAKTGDPRIDAYRALRTHLKGEIEKQVERTGLSKEFSEANSKAHDWIAVRDVSTQRAGFIAGNRTIGLTDTITGATGSSIGANLGGGFGAAFGGVAATTANKLMRSAAGDRLLATGLNQYTNWRNTVRASDAAAARLAAKTREIVKPVPLKNKVAGLDTRVVSEYEQQRERLVERQQNHERLLAELEAQLGDVREVSPELASATIEIGSRGMAYLSSILPKPAGFPDVVSIANKHALSVPESEAAIWSRVANTVDKPTSVLNATNEGALTEDQVKAVAAVYPKLYSAMQGQVTAEIVQAAQHGNVPDYQKRLQLSMLTGSPLDASMRPEVIAAYQNFYASLNTPQQSPKIQRSGGGTKFAARRENLTDGELR